MYFFFLMDIFNIHLYRRGIIHKNEVEGLTREQGCRGRTLIESLFFDFILSILISTSFLIIMMRLLLIIIDEKCLLFIDHKNYNEIFLCTLEISNQVHFHQYEKYIKTY